MTVEPIGITTFPRTSLTSALTSALTVCPALSVRDVNPFSIVASTRVPKGSNRLIGARATTRGTALDGAAASVVTLSLTPSFAAASPQAVSATTKSAEQIDLVMYAPSQ